MREIKFRAWDVDDKELFYFGIAKGMSEDCGEEYAKNHVSSVEQYTGIKDKNGVEIYEGDIVREIDDVDPTYDNRAKVEWASGLVGYHPFSSPALGGNEWENISPEDCVVIGNIHENSSLLDG